MKKKIKKGILFAVTVVIICIGFNSTVKSQSNNSKIQNQKEKIFTVVEAMPEYPGGENARMNFLANNIKYPATAREAGVQGRVYVTFVIEVDGSITDVKILRGIGSGCDEEAIRVVNSMPKWIPGKQRGKNVRVQFNLPIKFSLDDDATSDEEQIFLVVEEMPKYPGGDEARIKFLSENIKYPEYARKRGIEGRVYVQFVIEKDGSVSGGMVLRGIDGDCDEEAVRVVRAMPKWIPGTQRGEPVRVQFNLPIQFNLDGKAAKSDNNLLMNYVKPVDMPETEGGYDEIIKAVKEQRLQATIKSVEEKMNKNLTGIIIDEMPKIKGYEKITEFVKANLKYPEAARKAGIKGNVIITFVVEKDGSVSDIKLRKGIGSACDEEALRVARLMKFNPGKHKGKVVRTPYHFFAKFNLN